MYNFSSGTTTAIVDIFGNLPTTTQNVLAGQPHGLDVSIVHLSGSIDATVAGIAAVRCVSAGVTRWEARITIPTSGTVPFNFTFPHGTGPFLAFDPNGDMTCRIVVIAAGPLTQCRLGVGWLQGV